MLFLLIGALAAPSRAEKPYVNLDCQKNTSTYAHSGAPEKDGATQAKSGVNICRMRVGKEWEEATRTDCIKVWAPSIDGTGWKQGDVDCADRGLLSPLP